MEQPIVQATVIVLKYSISTGQWEELGSQKGTCAITIYKSPSNEYRFVSWKESNQEVVLNSFLFPAMNYNETTPTFHQWYDESKCAFGLNFADPNEAKKFGIAVVSALEILNSPRLAKPVIGDNVPVAKKSEKSPGYRTTKKKISIERPPASSTVSPYATTGINQMNDSSAAKPPTVATYKPTTGGAAPPPPGPPPAAPAPPGPPPTGPPPPCGAPAAPIVSIKKPANDFASQLLAASQNMKSSQPSSNSENSLAAMPNSIGSTSSVTPSKAASNTSAAPMDFLSELRMKSQKRTDSTNQNKKAELPKTTTLPPTTAVPPAATNITTKNSINQSSKISSSNSDLTTSSFVTPADLEKFRSDLMQDILTNMDKMKNEIISSIISKLN